VNDRRRAALLPQPDAGPRRARRVVVVGAGPGGLKAAEIAARRGHEVRRRRARSEPAAALRHVRATAARELYGAVTWLVDELRRLGVELPARRPASTPLAPERLGPDAVVLATGARRDAFASLDGAGDVRVLSSVEALADGSGAHGRGDRQGDVEAALVAEALVGRGAQVTFVTPFSSFAPRAAHQTPELKPVSSREAQCEIGEPTRRRRADHECRVPAGGAWGHVPTRARGRRDSSWFPPQPILALVPALEAMAIPYELVGDVVAPRGAGAGDPPWRCRSADDLTPRVGVMLDVAVEERRGRRR